MKLNSAPTDEVAMKHVDASLQQLLGSHAPVINLKHPGNGQEYSITTQTFGALSDDSRNPLSCVSVANSSLSIDMWKGCIWQCGYCHVHDAEVNHAGGGIMKMPNKPQLRTTHTPEDIVAALVLHPFFEAHKTVISLGTASTEPFDARVIDQVFKLIECIQARGLTNPIWIVTKNGVPNRALEKMGDCISRSSNFIISLTSGGLNQTIEPIQNDRFKNAEAAAALGAKIVLYLRPILEEWGSTPQKLTEILEKAKTTMGNQQFCAIAPGGLRWAEGVEIALVSHGLKWPEHLSKDPDAKEMPDHIFQHVLAETERLFPGVPLVKHSSCAISNILKQPDITLTFRRKVDECLNSTCSGEQRQRCDLANANLRDPQLVTTVNDRLAASNVPVTVHSVGEQGEVFLDNAHDAPLRYAVKRTVLKLVAATLHELNERV